MKATFNSIRMMKPVDTSKGLRYQFAVDYTDAEGNVKQGTFLSDTENQTVFKEGQENHFTEYKKDFNGKIYYNLYPPKKGGGTNFSRQMKQEQAKYSGFAMSYAKDLVVSGNIKEDQMFNAAEKMFDWMVKKDKELKDGK